MIYFQTLCSALTELLLLLTFVAITLPFSLPFPFVLYSCPCIQDEAHDLDALCLAKSYFDLKEYDRAAYFLRDCHSQKAYFLYMYSRYLVSMLTVTVHLYLYLFMLGGVKYALVYSAFVFVCFSRERRKRTTRQWTVWVRHTDTVFFSCFCIT